MSVDTPARIAIIGAGPMGIEAALYARYLGYEVVVYEQHSVGHAVLQAGEAVLPLRAGENRTPLGLAALRAQHEEFLEPDANSMETAREFAESYLLPLATTDLLIDGIYPEHCVVHIERTEFPDEVDAGDGANDSRVENDTDEMYESEEYEELAYAAFELRVRRADGSEFTTQAEVVIDASGISAASPISTESLRIIRAAESALTFQTAEPNYYVLGIKSSHDASSFNLLAGHDQIRQLFAIVGGRATLNLYATFPSRLGTVPK